GSCSYSPTSRRGTPAGPGRAWVGRPATRPASASRPGGPARPRGPFFFDRQPEGSDRAPQGGQYDGQAEPGLQLGEGGVGVIGDGLPEAVGVGVPTRPRPGPVVPRGGRPGLPPPLLEPADPGRAHPVLLGDGRGRRP